MRGNIQGKRVDYSARTVISVDPNINIDQFGMPKEIAMNLTFPEIVTDFNISKMRKIVINGPSNYPGAKTVTKNNGNSTGIFNISLKHVDVQKTAQELQIGDIVHRHLIDGDICLFNRQPTLHRMSMMGHKVKVLPGSTFRLNVTVCKPYNADFDGDEMNCHIPQSIQTFEELKRLTLVPTQIISPGNSVPCMPIVQDSLIAAYKLTQDNVKLTKNDMQNIMMFSETFNGILPKPLFIENGVELWSGKQLFSLIIPDVTTSNKNCKIVKQA
jgi:DNA-directed RNA polymerase beta' subunit